MSTEITAKPTNDDNSEHKLGRKEVIHLGFQNKTRGEAAFNLISYVGFGYFVVTATSVLMTWLLHDTKHIAPFFKKNVSDKLVTESSKKWGFGETAMNIVTLFIGGTIASVLPVKWLEDRKSKAVKKLDYMLYSEDQFYNDPKIQAAHKELDEMPKQTWLSVLGSRVVAFGATFAVFFAMGGNKSPVAKLTGHSLDELSTRAGRWLDGTLGKNNSKVGEEIERISQLNKEMPHEKGLPYQQVIRDVKDEKGNVLVKGDRLPSKIYSYLGLDMIYTVITSASLWVSTRIFGGLIGKPATAQLESPTTMAAEKKEGERAPFIAKSYENEPAQADNALPPTKITAPVHLDRVAEPHRSAELTA